jgi:hypothetical protein
MMTKNLLKGKNISKVLIVDDGYDDIPRLDDLAASTEDWGIFFDDLSDQDRQILNDTYPEYTKTTDEELTKNESFLIALWAIRGKLTIAVADELFATYDSSQQTMGRDLAKAETLLEGFGLTITKVGRNFVEAADDTDLILIDLFLGNAQSEGNMSLSIDGLKKVMQKRRNNPPLVVLMSSHTGISDKREEFRSGAGIFASGFRVLKKTDFNKPNYVEQALYELARHRDDSVKLTNFLTTWQDGLVAAIERTASDIQRLDLEDFAQLQDLLLDEEEVPLGSYILDLVDQVLLHEVEADKKTIAAAKVLNGMDSREHPPNTITGRKDTLSLIKKTLYTHENRRELDPEAGYPLAFGDIIALVRGKKAPAGSIFAEATDSVFAVMTPACDLLRSPPRAKRVLLLEGICKPVDAVGYNPKSGAGDSPKTIVLDLNGDQRVGVEWRPSCIVTLSLKDVKKLLKYQNIYIAGRLRGQAALALQQGLLSSLGRVGAMAPMPSTYSVKARLFYPDKQSILIELPLQLNGVCVVGRSKRGRVTRIAFDSSQRHEFIDTIEAAVPLTHGECRQKVKDSHFAECVDALFSQGFEIDLEGAQTKPKDCKIESGSNTKVIGKVIYRCDASEKLSDIGARRKSGLVIELSDV